MEKKKRVAWNKGLPAPWARNNPQTFKKGHVMSDKDKANLSKALKGRIFSEEHKLKLSLASKGRKKTKQHAINIGLAHRGMIAWNKGVKYEAISGEKHWNWKGGVTPLNKSIRMSLEYKLWRQAVFERDNFTCVFCQKRGGVELHPDHIKPFAYFPELRFAIDNGRTLCAPCHRKTDTYASKSMKYEF